VVIRIRYKKLGGHIHCRLFTSKAKNLTFGRCGELVFDEQEWDMVRDMLQSAIEFVPEESIESLAGHYLEDV
jgi:hypothetical protein